jgi:hypothetical protein
MEALGGPAQPFPTIGRRHLRNKLCSTDVPLTGPEYPKCPHVPTSRAAWIIAVTAFEIAAVDLSIISGNIVLFVCPSCGLIKAENRAEARRKTRLRVTELGRLLRGLKTYTMRG